MLKLLFIAFVELIKKGNTGINTITWFNQQYEITDQKHPINPPYVLVEIEPFDTMSHGRGFQMAEVFVKLHVVTDHHKDIRSDNPKLDDALDNFVICDLLNKALHGKQARTTENNEPIVSGISRARIETVHDYDNLFITIVTYKMNAYDCSGMKDKETWDDPENKLVLC